MRFDIVTIFPKMLESPLGDSIIKRACTKGIVEFFFHDIRDYATDKHRTVDDAPYGGGAGMIMKAGPLVDCVEAVERLGKSLRVLLTPQGEVFTQAIAREFAGFDQLILICGRYEGVDERARRIVAEREVSIGDYVTSGGEVPALVVIDTVVRLLPGALGNEASTQQESFEEGLLEYPQYTRPEVFRGERVPSVLMSGNHTEIEKWRREKAYLRTKERRPDMFDPSTASKPRRSALSVSKGSRPKGSGSILSGSRSIDKKPQKL